MVPSAGPAIDEHSQPHALVNLSRRIDRSINELLGLTKGIIADGSVSVAESDTLRAWINANPEAAAAWPGNVLAERVARIYNDGRVDDVEREELRCLLEDLAGGHVTEQGNASTRLPLDDQAPELRFDGSVYVFTGRFFSGTRQWCEAIVESRGGVCSSNVTRRTAYLVIGELGSRDWKHTSFGRKIQKAVEIRAAGRGLAIIAEDHWAECLHL
jgi:NAD-dependent DNA ligase